MLVDYCAGSQGGPMPLEAFGGTIGVTRSTLYEWAKEHQDFSDAIKIARGKSLESMMVIGHNGVMGLVKGFSCAAWIFMMKNMHGWSDQGREDELPDEQRARLKFNMMGAR
jgi:hypothetical protein